MAGIAGVSVFFVLSGYLITSLLVAEQRDTGRVNLKAFIVRRVRRLIPALVATIIGTGVILAVAGQFTGYPLQALVAASYLANFAPGGGASLGALDQTWSLAIEEQFYLLWPAAFLLLRGNRARLVLLGAGILWAVLGRLLLGDVPGRTDFRMDGLLIGCAIALFPIALPRWMAVVAGAVIGLTIGFVTDVILVMPIVAVATAVVILTRAPLTWRPLVRVGAISYGIYLYHNVFPYIGWWQSPSLVVAGIGLTFVAALASDRWLERRFRRQRSAPVEAPASSAATV